MRNPSYATGFGMFFHFADTAGTTVTEFDFTMQSQQITLTAFLMLVHWEKVI